MKQNIKINLRYIFIVIAIFFCLSPGFSLAQEDNTGSIENLIAANGFGNISLGEKISEIPKSKLVYMDGDSTKDLDGCVKYEYHNMDEVNNSSSIDLDMVGLRVYNGRIINIYLFFKKEYGYQMFQSFKSEYGNCTQRNSDFTYSWDSESVKLYLEYDKEYLGIAIFSSKKLYQEIAQNNLRRIAAQ